MMFEVFFPSNCPMEKWTAVRQFWMARGALVCTGIYRGYDTEVGQFRFAVHLYVTLP